MTRLTLQQRLPYAALGLVLATTAVIRARDLPWGMQGHPAFLISQHSDETRKVGYTLDLEPTFEGLRPNQWLLYKGTLLPTIGRLAWEVADAEAFGPLSRAYGAPFGSARWQYLFLRSISAIASLLLAGLVFELGRQLSGSAWAGVLSAGFLGLSFGAAYTGVTFKSDMLLATLIGGLLVATVAYVRRPSAFRALAMGAVLGLAGAAKHSAAFGVVLPIVACLGVSDSSWRKRLRHLSLAGAATLVTLVAAAPYYVLDFGELLKALEVVGRYQTERGASFEGFGFQPAAVIWHLLFVGLGPILTLLGLAGLAAAARRAWRGEREYAPLLLFGLVYFAVLSVASWLVLRYTLPLYPLLCALAGVLVWRAAVALATRGTLASRLGLGALAALVVGQLLWFLAFERMLSEPTPPAQAAAWLEQNLSPEARVLEIRRRPPIVYGFSPKAPLALRSTQVTEAVEAGQRLSSMPCDYVVVTEESYRHFFRLPDSRYAGYRRFYSELFDLRRFRPVARFDTRPRVLGIDLPKPFLPDDVVLVAPVTLVFERVGGGAPLPGQSPPDP